MVPGPPSSGRTPLAGRSRGAPHRALAQCSDSVRRGALAGV